MNFLITRYFYPLQRPITLSQKFRFALDNPRTEEETEALAQFIKASHDIATHRLPLVEQYGGRDRSVDDILKDLLTQFGPDDPYIQDVFNTYNPSEIYPFLARIWIVFRFDDKDAYEEDYPVSENSKRLIDYNYLLSLLIHNDAGFYCGNDFLVTYFPPHIGHRHEAHASLFTQLLYFGLACNNWEERMRTDPVGWTLFHLIRDRMTDIADQMEATLLDDTHAPQLMRIANMLRVAGRDIQDDRMKLVALISILEALYGADVPVKLSQLLHAQDPTHDVQAIRQELLTMYTIRDLVIGGRYADVQTLLEEIAAAQPEDDIFLETDAVIILSRFVSRLYAYIRATLEHGMQAPEFLELPT